MFEITQLKEKKLSELQEIAKELKISRYSSLKKLDLIYKILDIQAANPVKNKEEVHKTNQSSQSKTEFKPVQKKTKKTILVTLQKK